MIDAWNELESLPAHMAEAVKPHLATTTLAGYQHFLSAMVHYTRGSGERLRHAADRSKEPVLKAFFDRLAREEAGHYRLAEADLAAFGLTVVGETPDDVGAFHRAWMESESESASDDPAAWLGALYVLESVGGHLGEAAAKNLGRLGLGRDQVRFVMVHLEADTEHGAATAEHARRHLDGGGERMLASARAAAAFWIGLHVRAFSERAE